jgi:NADPH2:quinone reductase
VREHGGPEVLVLEGAEVGDPGHGELLVRQDAIGVNFSDVQLRIGGSIYAFMDLPLTPGVEGAGRVLAVGPGVDRFAPGDAIGYAGHSPGAYAEVRLVPADEAVRLSPGTSTTTAAAILTQGFTAHVLAREALTPFRRDGTVLVHAAAGGVASSLVQLLVVDGVRVLATTSTPEEAAVARELGAAEVFGYDAVPDAVRDLTNGVGVDAVFDGVGHDTFARSLASLRPRGCLIMFGEASGPPPPLEPAALGRGGSVFLTRVLLPHYVTSPQQRQRIADDLFAALIAGTLRLPNVSSVPFERSAEAHVLLQGRETIGKLLLSVDAR